MDILSVTQQNRGQFEILDESFNFNRREMVNVPLIGRVAAWRTSSGTAEYRELLPIPMEFMSEQSDLHADCLRREYD